MGKTTYQLVQDFSHQQYVSVFEGEYLYINVNPISEGRNWKLHQYTVILGCPRKLVEG